MGREKGRRTLLSYWGKWQLVGKLDYREKSEGKSHFKRFITKRKEDKRLGSYTKRAF